MSENDWQDRPATDGSWLAANPSTATASCLCTVESFSSPVGEIILLRVVGEVDLATISVLETTLAASIGQPQTHLIVDLARLHFCSARGMAVLLRAGAIAADRGLGYAISSVPSYLDRIWEAFWPEELPIRYESAATGMHAIRTRHARSGS